jgi:hypothetical protein
MAAPRAKRSDSTDKRKVGFVLECQRDGAEHQILEHVISVHCPNVAPVYNFQRSKGYLLKGAGEAVAGLLDAEHCARVFVIWDLMPCDVAFRNRGRPSCHNERAHVLGLLRATDVARTTLLCVTHEIEAWLLADGTALAMALSTAAHQVGTIADDKDPEGHRDPKAALTRIFRNNGKSRGYEHIPYAKRIITNAQPNKIARVVPSFARLLSKLATV